MQILALSQCDIADIENLLDAAFGADRKLRTAYLLRQGVDYIAPLSFGLLDNGALVGSIQCWPVKLIAHDCNLVLVGPVAVSPARQNEGFGHKLMHATLDAAALHGDPAMVMIGDPEYYERFGFYANASAGWKLPGPWEPRRLLVRNAANVSLPITDTIGPDVAYAL